jgi:sugar lactone lactonase YvrE
MTMRRESNVVSYPQPDIVLCDPGSIESDGPVVDERTGRLVWADLLGGRMYENDLASGQQSVLQFDTVLGAVAPRSSGTGFAVAFTDGFATVENGEVCATDDVLPEPFLRMSTGKVDSRGRFWAGSACPSSPELLGRLHRWDGVRPSVVVATGLVLPDGLAWNADDTVMYVTDSRGGVIYRAPFDVEDGAIGKISVLATPAGPGIPDGVAADADGGIWVAMWKGGEVHRYDAEGRLVAVVPLPVSQPSGCAFGNDGVLYITSARSGLTPLQLQQEPLAGSVFALATDTVGVPIASFAA